MSDSLSPIILFVYNRIEHTKRTVNSLLNNTLANQSDLIVYSDASRSKIDNDSVDEVRAYLTSITGFKTIKIIHRENNFGLAKSIIEGVTKVLSEYDRAIIIEDDLMFSDDFLLFMNTNLDFYKDETKVMSVGGYNFPIAINSNYQFDVYCSYRTVSWGWGTWTTSWNKANWNIDDYDILSTNRKLIHKFNRGGADLYYMLKKQKLGMIDSWSIRWDYIHTLNNALSILPIKTRVVNIGQDGSGVHCKTVIDSSNTINVLEVNSEDDINLISEIIVNEFYIFQIYKLHGTKLYNYIKFHIKKILQGK